MKSSPVFLTVDNLIAIHRRMIQEFGGDQTLRDHGLLESAVAMPAAGFGGEYLHKRFSDKAGASLFHVCKNHAFVDGNKRTAVAAAEMFIRLNGHELSASDELLEELTLGVAGGTVSKDQCLEFFRQHVV